MEPRYAKAYIREFVRILRPGGACLFQMPSHVQKHAGITGWMLEHTPKFLVPMVRALYYRKSKVINAVMEFHCIPKDEMISWIGLCGGMVSDVVADHWVYRRWASYTYMVTKRERESDEQN